MELIDVAPIKFVSSPPVNPSGDSGVDCIVASLPGATKSAPLYSPVVSGSGFLSKPIATHLLSRMESQNHLATQDAWIGAPVGMPVPLIPLGSADSNPGTSWSSVVQQNIHEDSDLNPTTKPTRPKAVVAREAYYATPNVAASYRAAPAHPSVLPGVTLLPPPMSRRILPLPTPARLLHAKIGLPLHHCWTSALALPNLT
ncbi:hypothetical protein Nepgr_018824 [Nepenthes gracilis]|uniref:Uncharacterized protein n=1 Tax=Nepenthes gracilis TaxID=150966 RepID=A0AAD3SS19_NEPGR|nr:hypothetical protein Nepgr_018824 [Nepenthes gracilis]